MAGYKIIFESEECITGIIKPTREWITYESILRVKDGGKTPVTIDMTFASIHPFAFNMTETHRIQAKSITEAYIKVIKFLRPYDIEFRNGNLWRGK